MIIKHLNGPDVDTDKLSDVDSELIEGCENLYKLFKKYNRKLCLIGQTNTERGASFFHIENPDSEKEKINKEILNYYAMIDSHIRTLSGNKLCIKSTDEISN